jgi:LysM repeat protein
MSSAKSLTEMGLNTAMMCAFAVGPEGAPIGAVLAIGSFFVGLLWPDSSQSVPPEDRPASTQQIDNDFANLKAEIEEILAKAKIAGDVGAVSGKTKTLNDNWRKILNVKIDKTGYHFLQDPSDTNFINGIDTYFQTGANGGLIDDTNGYLYDIQLSGLPDTKTFGIYTLIGSLRVAYLKYAVVWAWGKQVRYSLPYTEYLIARKAYNKACDADPTYADTNPKPTPPDPSVSTQLPEWQDWVKTTGCPVKELIDEVNSLVRTCEGPKGMYTTIAAHWADRLAQVNARVRNFTTGSITLNGVAGWYVNDGATGVYTYAGDQPQHQELAEAWADLMAGSQIAYLWNKLTDDYSLDGVKEDDIADFGKTIEQWKLTRDSVRFKTYTMKDGDTLVNIARAYYTPELLGYNILETNPAFQDDAHLLSTVTSLNIPGSTTPYAVQPGDTLTSIAASQLKATGDAMDIFKANSLSLLPRLIVPGLKLSIPDLNDSSKSTAHTVALGESIYSIAANAYSDADLTAKIRNATDPTLTGKSIVIPDNVLRIPDL